MTKRILPNGHPLTDEQDYAVELALKGDTLVIEAFAGSGKTTTIQAVGKELKGRGFYLAFNAAIVRDAKDKFPPHIACRTNHSLAFRTHGFPFKERLNKRLNGTVLSEALKVYKSYFEITPAMFCNLVIDTMNRYASSADIEFTARHVPWNEIRKINDDEKAKAIGYEVFKVAIDAWRVVTDRRSELPISHDYYLKLWAMSEPQLDVDFILYDEAQDASPVMMDVVAKQRNSQVIYVGDQYQQIYSWRGAVNAIQRIETRNRCKITQSFRFGQPIADAANVILNEHLEADVYVRGFDKVNSNVSFDGLDDHDMYLSRTNAGLVKELFRQYEMDREVAIVGGCKGMIETLDGIHALKKGKKVKAPALSMFRSYDDLLGYVDSGLGAEIKTMIDLLKEYGIRKLKKALTQADKCDEEAADIILSTAHKAKGREFGTVKLADDFRKPGSKGYSEEESNLLYVAATRAINTLDISDCSALLDDYPEPEET